MGGHGFPAVAPLVHPLYAASIADSVKLRISNPSLLTPEFYYHCTRSPLKKFVGNLPPLAEPPDFHFQRNMEGCLERYES